MRRLAPLLLVAAACSAAPSPPPAPEPTQSGLLGQWRIVALNGRGPAVGRDGNPPVLTFMNIVMAAMPAAIRLAAKG